MLQSIAFSTAKSVNLAILLWNLMDRVPDVLQMQNLVIDFIQSCVVYPIKVVCSADKESQEGQEEGEEAVTVRQAAVGRATRQRAASTGLRAASAKTG